MKQRHPGRRAHSDANVPQSSVEFLDGERVGEGVTEPAERTARPPRWPTRAVTIVLITAATTAWIATRAADEAPLTAPPHHNALPRPDHLPKALTSAIDQALPGISISGAVVRVAGPVASRRSWVVAGAVDANYRGLIIQVQIVPGSSSSETLVQILTTGASDMYLIHNRSQSALRTVTITAIASHIAHCPTLRLRRMADTLSRLPYL